MDLQTAATNYATAVTAENALIEKRNLATTNLASFQAQLAQAQNELDAANQALSPAEAATASALEALQTAALGGVVPLQP